MKNISEGHLDFKTFESILFETMCKVAREQVSKYLALVDLSIKGTRDSKEYRLVDNRKTTVKTMFGEVPFSRGYYKKNTGGYTFLLDTALDIFTDCGLVSANLAEQIVIECTEKSFRKATASICNFTGQDISAMGAWNVVQKYATAIEQQEVRLQELDDSGSTGHLGNISTSVLFGEYDDVWISRQPEKRHKKGEVSSDTAEKKRKKIGKKPMHIGVAYTGWTQSKDGRFNTADKIAYASYGKASDFVSLFETLLRHRYDMDGIEQRVTNGDGEPWIRTAAEEIDSILQLDPYHRSRAVVKAISDKEDRQMVFDAISEKDVDKTLGIVSALAIAADDEKSQEKLCKLYEYFSGNRDSFLTWQERGIKLPAPPANITYRNMGVMEPNNCSLITQRMKHRKGSWSEQGANHMGKLLCIRNTIGFDTLLGILPEPEDSAVWKELLSASQTPKHDGKGYGADWLQVSLPFGDAFRSNGSEAIREIFRLKPFSDLPFVIAPGIDHSCLMKR